MEETGRRFYLQHTKQTMDREDCRRGCSEHPNPWAKPPPKDCKTCALQAQLMEWDSKTGKKLSSETISQNAKNYCTLPVGRKHSDGYSFDDKSARRWPLTPEVCPPINKEEPPPGPIWGPDAEWRRKYGSVSGVPQVFSRDMNYLGATNMRL